MKFDEKKNLQRETLQTMYTQTICLRKFEIIYFIHNLKCIITRPAGAKIK